MSSDARHDTSEALVLLRRGLQRGLVFRPLVIFDQAKSPADESRQIFRLRFFIVQELLDSRFQFRLLVRRIEYLENLHRQ